MLWLPSTPCLTQTSSTPISQAIKQSVKQTIKQATNYNQLVVHHPSIKQSGDSEQLHVCPVFPATSVCSSEQSCFQLSCVPGLAVLSLLNLIGHLGLPLLIWWVDTMTNSE
jgi:hypothetical protein